jgi:hypothetical protein
VIRGGKKQEQEKKIMDPARLQLMQASKPIIPDYSHPTIMPMMMGGGGGVPMALDDGDGAVPMAVVDGDSGGHPDHDRGPTMLALFDDENPVVAPADAHNTLVELVEDLYQFVQSTVPMDWYTLVHKLFDPLGHVPNTMATVRMMSTMQARIADIHDIAMGHSPTPGLERDLRRQRDRAIACVGRIKQMVLMFCNGDLMDTEYVDDDDNDDDTVPPGGPADLIPRCLKVLREARVSVHRNNLYKDVSARLFRSTTWGGVTASFDPNRRTNTKNEVAVVDARMATAPRLMQECITNEGTDLNNVGPCNVYTTLRYHIREGSELWNIMYAKRDGLEIVAKYFQTGFFDNHHVPSKAYNRLHRVFVNGSLNIHPETKVISILDPIQTARHKAIPAQVYESMLNRNMVQAQHFYLTDWEAVRSIFELQRYAPSVVASLAGLGVRMVHEVGSADLFERFCISYGCGRCGKSSYLKGISSCYRPDKVASVVGPIEVPFGLHPLSIADVILMPEISDSMSKDGLRIEVIKAICSGDPVPVARKNLIATTQRWTTPMWAAGNQLMSTEGDTGGAVTRRALPHEMQHRCPDRLMDTGFERRIVGQMGAFIYSGHRAYECILRENGSGNVMNTLPLFFTHQLDLMKVRTNRLLTAMASMSKVMRTVESICEGESDATQKLLRTCGFFVTFDKLEDIYGTRVEQIMAAVASDITSIPGVSIDSEYIDSGSSKRTVRVVRGIIHRDLKSMYEELRVATIPNISDVIVSCLTEDHVVDDPVVQDMHQDLLFGIPLEAAPLLAQN